MFGRCFSALLVPVVRSKILWTSLHWNVLWMFNEVFFSKFLECSMFIKSFWRLQHSSKDVVLKVSPFCSYENKRLAIRRKNEDYGPRNQKSKNGMSADYRYLASQITQETQNFFKGNMSFSKEIVKNWDTANTAWLMKFSLPGIKHVPAQMCLQMAPMLKEEAMLIKERLNNRKV